MPNLFTTTVADYRAEAKDVVVLELRRPDGAQLPDFEPGAHLDVWLPNGLVRQYSLTGDPADHSRYLLGVLREPPARGTGGSEYVHRSLAAGMTLEVSQPINNFALEPAPSYRFIAGGIGITPILAMVRHCLMTHHPWRLVYATRDRCRTAFYEELLQLASSNITWHFDDEVSSHLDVTAALDGLAPDELVYCCGPRPLMSSVREHLADRLGSARFESFIKCGKKIPNIAMAASSAERGFTVTLKRSGVSLTVPSDKSILEVLEENGFSVPFSCQMGECGTCVTRVCAGIPDHRDYVLSNEERASNQVMCLCVSRALSEDLVLDL